MAKEKCKAPGSWTPSGCLLALSRPLCGEKPAPLLFKALCFGVTLLQQHHLYPDLLTVLNPRPVPFPPVTNFWFQSEPFWEGKT